MRAGIQKWLVILTILLGVPIGLIWLSMPYLDLARANYLAVKGDYPLAIRALTRATLFNPRLPIAYTRRGWLYSKLGQPDKALADYDTAISLDNAQWQPYNNRAWLLAETMPEDFSKALADVNRALELCPDCYEAYDTRGLIKLKQNQTQEALADLDRSLTLNPKFGEGYFHRAECYLRLDQPKKAKEDLKRARELGFVPPADFDFLPAPPGQKQSAFSDDDIGKRIVLRYRLPN